MHLFKTNKIYTGTYHKILASDHFSKDLETFIDQLYRHSDAYRYKSHNLKNLQDYLDYYHIHLIYLFGHPFLLLH